MRVSRHHAIRQVLRNHGDGLSVGQILTALREQNEHENAIRRAVAVMPDVYIDRWERGMGKKYRAVYCIVTVPENCPHPLKQQVTT